VTPLHLPLYPGRRLARPDRLLPRPVQTKSAHIASRSGGAVPARQRIRQYRQDAEPGMRPFGMQDRIRRARWSAANIDYDVSSPTQLAC
jgi:hypothetical protein